MLTRRFAIRRRAQRTRLETITTNKVVEVAADTHGGVLLEDLETRLREHAQFRTKIGSFSAASNITGIIENVDAVTAMLHTHGALSFWDYAAAAPHSEINMNPRPHVELQLNLA